MARVNDKHKPRRKPKSAKPDQDIQPDQGSNTVEEQLNCVAIEECPEDDQEDDVAKDRFQDAVEAEDGENEAETNEFQDALGPQDSEGNGIVKRSEEHFENGDKKNKKKKEKGKHAALSHGGTQRPSSPERVHPRIKSEGYPTWTSLSTFKKPPSSRRAESLPGRTTTKNTENPAQMGCDPPNLKNTVFQM